MCRGSHVVFSIHLHIVFVTKYRRQVLTPNMIQDMKQAPLQIVKDYIQHQSGGRLDKLGAS
ncbi:MAG: transposase [Calothrix sp. MO_167.B12]|nr:transposase [Calothrix sp. MO_167.B12]